MDWFIENRDWLFSGVGVAVVGWLLARYFGGRSSSHSTQTQSGGKGSTNIQAGGSINLGNELETKDDG